MTTQPENGPMSPNSLHSLLEEAFDGQPPGLPADELERGGRRRLRRRRAAIAAGALVALGAVSIAGVLVGGVGPDTSLQPPPAATVERSTIPPGWRVLHSEGTTFGVPRSWRPGNPSQWCVARTGVPTYALPGEGASSSAACNPQNGYGVALKPANTVDSQLRGGLPVQQPGEGNLPRWSFPARAWVGSARVSDAWVLVVAAKSKSTARQVLTSAQPAS